MLPSEKLATLRVSPFIMLEGGGAVPALGGVK